jgi:hypothetical protein
MVFTIALGLCLLSRVAQVGLLAMGPEELGVSGSLVMLSDERGFSKIQRGGVYRWEMTAKLAAKPGVEHAWRLLTRQSGDWRSRGRRLRLRQSADEILCRRSQVPSRECPWGVAVWQTHCVERW